MGTTPVPDRSSATGWPGWWYLTALLVAPVLREATATAAPDATLGSLPVSSAVVATAYLAAAVLWLGYRPVDRWGRTVGIWLVASVGLWGFVTFTASSPGADVSRIVLQLGVPVTLLLVLARRPSGSDVRRAADILVATIAVVSAAWLVGERAGWIPSWYERTDAPVGLLESDQTTYWLPISGLVGLDGRWGGPFAHPNPTGVALALVVVYGIARGRRLGFTVAGVGLLGLLLTGSRTAFACAAVGLVAVALLPGWARPWRALLGRRALAGVLGALLGTAVAVAVSSNPGLTGRTAMWPDFLALGQQSPLTGVGDQVITLSASLGVLPSWAWQAHNLYIDTLVRHGLVGLVLTLAVLLLAVAIGVMGTRHRNSTGLALMAALAAGTITETLLDWRYPAVTTTALLVAVLLSATPETDPSPSSGSEQTAPS